MTDFRGPGIALGDQGLGYAGSQGSNRVAFGSSSCLTRTLTSDIRGSTDEPRERDCRDSATSRRSQPRVAELWRGEVSNLYLRSDRVIAWPLRDPNELADSVDYEPRSELGIERRPPSVLRSRSDPVVERYKPCSLMLEVQK